MSFYSDFTVNKTEVFESDKRIFFFMDPLTIEIRSEDQAILTNKIKLNTRLMLVTNRLKEMRFRVMCCLLLTLRLFRFFYIEGLQPVYGSVLCNHSWGSFYTQIICLWGQNPKNEEVSSRLS